MAWLKISASSSERLGQRGWERREEGEIEEGRRENHQEVWCDKAWRNSNQRR